MADNSNNNNNNGNPGVVSSLTRATMAAQHRIEDALGGLGRKVGTYPGRFVIGALVFTFLCALGFANFEVLSEGDKLWISQTSDPAQHRDYVQGISTFGKPPRFMSVLLMDKDPDSGVNVLTVAAVQRLFELYDKVRTHDNGGMEKLCVRRLTSATTYGPCVVSDAVLSFWSANSTKFEQDVVQGRTASQQQARLLEVASAATLPTGAPVKRGNMFASVKTDNNGKLLSATGLHFSVWMRSDDAVLDDILEWEQSVLDMLKVEAAASNPPYLVVYFGGRSLDDELARSVGGDIPLMMLTYLAMIIFVCATLGKFDRVRSRVALGTAGVFTIILSVVAGYGINSGMSVPFTSLNMVLPFILVGIGADDIFIIVAVFDRTNPKRSLPSRMERAFREAGLAISVTSSTSAAAFILGSFTIIPAVKFFCYYASISILMTYFYMLTMFSALLVYDTRRQLGNRIDCCCCFTSSRRHGVSNDVTELARVKGSAVHLQTTNKSSSVADLEAATQQQEQQQQKQQQQQQQNDGIDESEIVTVDEMPNVARFFYHKYGPFLLQPKVRVAVVVAFLGLLVWSAVTVPKVTQGFELTSIVPDDSYVRDYLNTQRTYFTEQSYFLDVYVKDVPYHSAETQTLVTGFVDANAASPWTEGPVQSWLHSYQSYYRTNAALNGSLTTYQGAQYLTDDTTFYTGLQSFLNTQNGLRFRSDLHFNSDNTRILASRAHMFLVPAQNSDRQKSALLATREIAEQSPLNANGAAKAFSYSAYFLFWESFLIIYQELVQNFLLSGTAVALVCLFFLVRPSAAAIVVSIVGMIYVSLLASIYHWGLEINSVTVINLTMSTGLIVDSLTHVAHSFLHQQGDRKHRAIMSLTNMGSSIMLGGSTTLLGVMPLFFSQSDIFKSFSKSFLGIIGYGMLHGLVFLPVLLSWFGPDSVTRSDNADRKSSIIGDGLKSRPNVDKTAVTPSASDETLEYNHSQ